MKAGWRKLRIGDWGDVVGGRQRSPHLTAGTPRPYLRVANVFEDRVDTSDVLTMLFTDAEFERYKLKRGDILLNEGQSLELVGRSAIYEGKPAECAFQNTLVRFRAGQDCDYRFAQQVFKQLWRTRVFQGIAKRTTSIAHLGVNRFADLMVSVPPLPVQRTIAEQLGLFDTAIGTIDRLIDAKRTFKRGLMQQLLTGRKRFPQFRKDKWLSVALGDLISYTPRKIPKPSGSFLSAGVRSHGKGVFLKKDFFADGIALEELFELKHRDLVVNITFGWEGAVAIVPLEADGALVSHRFPTYEIDESKVLVEYLRHVIRSRRFVFDVGVASPGGAGRNRVLNRQEFLEIILRIPGTDEQERIAGLLNDCDREVDLLAAQREQVESYRRALLSRLLSGSLPLPA